MRNLESKFSCPDHAEVLERALGAGATDQGFIDQRDVFFVVPHGRLKLRYLDDRGELIAYRRGDDRQARISDYGIAVTPDAAGLEAVLAGALRRSACVAKRRHLLLCRHTRIHLDVVQGLGTYVELETVVDGITEAESTAEHAAIVALLGLEPHQLIAVAYVDLLTSS